MCRDPKYETILGIIKKWRIGAPRPNNWRVLTINEANRIKSMVNRLIEENEFLAFGDGTLTGDVKGNEFLRYIHTDCKE